MLSSIACTAIVVGLITYLLLIMVRPPFVCLRGTSAVHPPLVATVTVLVVALAASLPAKYWWSTCVARQR